MQAPGYTPPTGPAAEILRAYANVRHRRVAVRRRAVHKVPYVVPPHLIAGEQAFLTAVTAGADLRPYQSTRLEDQHFDDGMLNEFGIQHFHLGRGPHQTRPTFKERTEPVLVAIVRENDFYSLGCHPHGAWSQQSLLDLTHATWPRLLSTPIDAHMRVAFNPNDADVAALRKEGISAITQRPDGTTHVSLGGGLTMNRKSAKVAYEVSQIKSRCNQIERRLKSEISAMIASGELLTPVTVRLVHRGNDAVAMVEGVAIEFTLGPVLLVPPL